MIEAAGGVVWRRTNERTLEVLVVHRPRYDDWTLPKGKLERGETAVTAALREVEEETGLRCLLDAELPAVHYLDHNGRPKHVRYWAMQVRDGSFEPNAEVDEVRWVPVDGVAALLSHGHDSVVVDALRDLPPAAG